MCNKANIMKKFFIITKDSSVQLHSTVIKVLKYQPYIDNIYKTNILYKQKYLDLPQMKLLDIKLVEENKLQLIPFEIPASYFLS
jgi:hypothetical protein